MSGSYSGRVRLFVELRAHLRCEYCRRPQPITGVTFHIEHVTPRAQGGRTRLDNLALACPNCNYRKADQRQAEDPKTGRPVMLYNPRRNRWAAHFRWSRNRLMLQGRTAKGRATIKALGLNQSDHQAFRRLWKERFRDLFPFD